MMLIDQIEMERLWEMVKAGHSADEIMETLDIREMATLKQALAKAMRQKGETVEVPGLVEVIRFRPRYTEGGIRIEPSMLEGTEFRSGDLFDMRVEGDRIVLQRSSERD
jgi:hypothetical protein